MRKILPMLAVCGLFLGASLSVLAADEKTITGSATCAKCALKEAKACQNVVIVKDGDKEVKYYMSMKNKVASDNHAKAGFCKSEKKVKVTGEVSEKDGKKFIDPKKIEVVEE
ncbi:MAG: hypothetical protein JWN86_853 [Planctomycetota bacterium]|nr:hypothetical protein [Planctomycetota bacterium]